jgi:pilus assembly protein FimV
LKRKSIFSGRFALNTIAAALCVIAPAAWALGLGKLQVQSSLGESLRAEIDVTSLSPEEASKLRVRVAPPESYKAAGVEYNAVLPNTQAVLQYRADGRPYLRLSSDRGVQEPFVDVILELSWPTGRLVREYTLLFDPPAAIARNSPPVAVAPNFLAASPAEAASSAVPVRSRVPSTRAVLEGTASAVSSEIPLSASGDTQYRVKGGDTLSRIASRVQRPGVSLDQMLVSLYRSNPQAFLENNMNRLKAGAVLSVPSVEKIKDVGQAESRQIIRAQSEDFGAYRQRLVGALPLAKADSGNARQASGKVRAEVEDRSQGAAPSPDKLTLSKGAAGSIGKTDPVAGDSAALEREKKAIENRTRVAELSKNVGELKKLSSAAASTPAAVLVLPPAVVAPATTVPSAIGSLNKPSAPAPSVAVVGDSAVPKLPVAVVSVPVPVIEPASAAVLPPVARAASSIPVVPPTAVVAASSMQRTAPVRVNEAPGGAASLMSSPWIFGLGAFAIALAGFGLYRYSKRAKRDSGETSFLESRLQPDSFFGASGGQRIDTRDAAGSSSSMTYSLSQLDAIGDVDPVAEADVYLAYGRDLQAEEILKEAMRSNPERMAIRTKLLEVYAKRRDTKGFELLATQLYALTRGVGEDWARAQELGVEIDPENPLFKAGGIPAVVTGKGGEVVEPLGASTMPQSVLPSPLQYSQALGGLSAPNEDLDLDLGNPQAGVPTAPAPLGDFSMPRSAPVRNAQAGISLDLDLPPDDDKSFASAGRVSGYGELELPELGADGGVQDPLSRKLELAEEFRQIGDKDGARDLLNEVISHATGSVQTKAKNMLAELG